MMIKWNLMPMMMKSNIYSIFLLCLLKIFLIKSDQDDYSDDDDVLVHNV
jgi:hypothetical protein